MDSNFSKIAPIFKYYQYAGFDQSMQKIADSVKVTKKTLFNRYKNKENLEYNLMNYWQFQSCQRVVQRMEYANNAVEKLLIYLFELQYCKNHEWFFFQKMRELFLEKTEQMQPLFILQLEKIFNMGTKEELFIFDSDPKVFAYFFQFNSLYVLLSSSTINTDYISFLLSPILTKKGKIVFQDIDIEQIFKYF